MNKAVISAAVVAALSLSQAASAIEFDGFLSAGFAIQSEEDATYLDTITDDVRFDNDSKFGLQLTADVADNMQVVSQILASGADENFDLDVEWAYLDWRLNNAVSLRGGKIKEPVFLISDYFEVGYAYPWIRPPQEVYRNNPINTINGMSGLIQTEIGGVGLNIQPYIGSNNEDVPNFPGVSFDATNFFGAAIQLQSRNYTFQLSFLDTDVFVSGLPGPSTSEGSATLASAGFSADIKNIVIYTEYVTRDIEADTGTPLDSLFTDQDAWYFTFGYRMGNFLPHITVANSEAEPLPGADQTQLTPSPGVSQDSITLGVRYEINDSAAFKFEVQSIEPDLSASDSPGLLSNTPSGGFVDGDNVTVVSASVDVIF